MLEAEAEGRRSLRSWLVLVASCARREKEAKRACRSFCWHDGGPRFQVAGDGRRRLLQLPTGGSPWGMRGKEAGDWEKSAKGKGLKD